MELFRLSHIKFFVGFAFFPDAMTEGLTSAGAFTRTELGVALKSLGL
jgi:hypothetical protein